MDWCQIAVFLYVGALVHFVADLLSHKKKRGKFIFLHCFLYAMFFIPLFWWMNVNPLWLLLIFSSHLIIDFSGMQLLRLVDIMTKETESLKESFLAIIALGVDQVLHLSMLVVIAVVSF